MKNEEISVIDKDSANVISGIITGSAIGIAIYAVVITFIYLYLL